MRYRSERNQEHRRLSGRTLRHRCRSAVRKRSPTPCCIITTYIGHSNHFAITYSPLFMSRPSNGIVDQLIPNFNSQALRIDQALPRPIIPFLIHMLFSAAFVHTSDRTRFAYHLGSSCHLVLCLLTVRSRFSSLYFCALACLKPPNPHRPLLFIPSCPRCTTRSTSCLFFSGANPRSGHLCASVQQLYTVSVFVALHFRKSRLFFCRSKRST